MKDEEMAFDNWWKGYGKDRDSCEYVVAKDGFLAGHKAARQWHNLEKDPTDLPKDRRNVYVVYLNDENFYDRTIAAYRYKYWCIDGHKTDYEIVAWYELPTWGK